MRGALARTLLIAPKSWLLGPVEDREGTPSAVGAGQARGQRPAPWLGHLLLISLLLMLNLTLIFTLNTGMDLYGFYTLKPLSAQPLPAVLCTLLNVFLAVAAYVFYRWLYRRHVWFTGEHWGPFRRGAILSGAPVLLAYGPSMALTSHGGKPSVFVVAALITGSLCVIHALRDSEMVLDEASARHWFIGAIAAILVFLILSIGGMMLLYYVEQMPASGNLLWTWNYEWSDLGYPREQFVQRQRDALVAFTLLGSGFMIFVLGGSMLGAILRWTRGNSADTLPAQLELPESPEWATEALVQLDQASAPPPTDSAYAASFGGYEVALSRKQYELLVGNKDILLSEADLLIDKVSGMVLRQTQLGWERIEFRAGKTQESRRSGPFLLLCIYANSPGKRFTNTELQDLLWEDLPDRLSLNVTDFFNQLRDKRPSLPVSRDHHGTCLPQSFKACILTNQGPVASPNGPADEVGGPTSA